MTSLDTVCGSLQRLAPLRLAENWDNVGLLVGDRRQPVARVMTCLTITPGVVQEAVDEQVDLIVTHHPLPFKPLSRITADSISGSMLLRLIGQGIAVYSAHTAFDSAAGGINQMWGELLGLGELQPLIEFDASAQPEERTLENPLAGLGSGRFGRLDTPVPLGPLITRAAEAVGAPMPRLVGAREWLVTTVALACGSGGSFLAAADRHGCDCLITGEATFHVCLEAQSRGIGLGLLGHYFSERFAMERMAESLGKAFPDVVVWPSRSERDPICLA